MGSQDFNVEVGKIFMALKGKDTAAFESLLSDLRVKVARGMSTSSTASLSTAHPLTIKLHALYEIERISAVANPTLSSSSLVDVLNKRLDILGAFTCDKQYLLGVRRAAMQLSM
jgi:serine/threonine-protein kinase ATR